MPLPNLATKSEESAQIELTAEIVSAFVSRNSLPSGELPALIYSVHTALAKLSSGAATTVEPAAPVPVVSVRKSITPDYLVCLEDGRHFKSLRRHLSTSHGMTPEQYREKWKLPSDYPVVAANYAAQRSELAKKIGLGQIPRETGKPTSKPKRGRPAKVTTETPAV
jgi:predicted transcriptional regulator